MKPRYVVDPSAFMAMHTQIRERFDIRDDDWLEHVEKTARENYLSARNALHAAIGARSDYYQNAWPLLCLELPSDTDQYKDPPNGEIRRRALEVFNARVALLEVDPSWQALDRDLAIRRDSFLLAREVAWDLFIKWVDTKATEALLLVGET